MRYLILVFLTLLLPTAMKAQPGIITTYAGNGSIGFSGDGGLAVDASFMQICYLRYDRNHNLYITSADNRIRKVSDDGFINTIAGTGGAGYSGDGGPATNAEFSFMSIGSIATDLQGNIYVCDVGSHRIRKISAIDNIVTTIAGTGIDSFSGDGGLAIDATLQFPVSMVVANNGVIYFCDGASRRVRKIDTAGVITTIAGNGQVGSTGDGGPALNARIYASYGMAIDYANDNLILAESNKVRKINLTTGIITTIAGTVIPGYNGDGIPAINAQLDDAKDVATDVQGNIYISEFLGSRIRKIDTAGIIHTVAGTDSAGYNGDGILATTAQLHYASSMALDSCGNIFIGDVLNRRIRKVTYPVCSNLNVHSAALKQVFSIYPNPVASTLTIISNTKINSISIIDITGREVLRSRETMIDMSGLVSGMYFVRVRDESGSEKVEKVVKQ